MKFSLIALLSLLLAFFSWNQTAWGQTIELSDFDFSSAQVSLAGTRQIYIRSVRLGEQPVSLLISMKDGSTWTIDKIISEESVLPEDLILNFLEISVSDDDKLLLSGILLEGKFISGTFQFDGSNRFKQVGDFEEADLPSNLKQRADSLKQTLVGQEKLRYEQEKRSLLTAMQELKQENEQLSQDKAIAEKQPEELSADMNLSDLEARLTKILIKGFEKGQPYLGAWKFKENTVEQFDSSQYFAKLVFPVVQPNKPTLFSFSARAEGKGWLGMGLHIYVRDAELKKGYGLGKSLLVWLTRDPDAYGNMNTYIQLYSSTNAVAMKRVLEAAIPEPITQFNAIAILYDPQTEYITIEVNGVEKIRYKTWFSISSGAEIALRTLKGKTIFKDLLVRTIE
jgi:hypothetical protein